MCTCADVAAVLHAEARGSWTSKQDLIQVFGLRKVYKLAGGRRWWQFWRPKQPQQQEKKQYVAVADSWFGVPKGQLLCLLGPNGAGKTTSINCLIGASSGGLTRTAVVPLLMTNMVQALSTLTSAACNRNCRNCLTHPLSTVTSGCMWCLCRHP